MFPFIIGSVLAYSLFRFNRLYSKSKAYSVGNFAELFECRLVIIKFMPVNPVSIYYDMIMGMLLINMRCDNDLTIITKCFTRKGSRYFVSKF